MSIALYHHNTTYRRLSIGYKSQYTIIYTVYVVYLFFLYEKEMVDIRVVVVVVVVVV